jgi:hypothetical protein
MLLKPGSEACSTAATTNPTNTTVTDYIWGHITSSDVVPRAGETFMIRDRLRGRVTTLEERNLRLKADVSRMGGWHWICVEKDGWLGFRNPDVYRTCALLLVFIKPNALQPLIDIKTKISLFVKMLRPPGYELLICIIRLGRDIYHGLAEELDHAFFECLLARVPCSN